MKLYLLLTSKFAAQRLQHWLGAIAVARGLFGLRTIGPNLGNFNRGRYLYLFKLLDFQESQAIYVL